MTKRLRLKFKLKQKQNPNIVKSVHTKKNPDTNNVSKRGRFKFLSRNWSTHRIQSNKGENNWKQSWKIQKMSIIVEIPEDGHRATEEKEKRKRMAVAEGYQTETNYQNSCRTIGVKEELLRHTANLNQINNTSRPPITKPTSCYLSYQYNFTNHWILMAKQSGDINKISGTKFQTRPDLTKPELSKAQLTRLEQSNLETTKPKFSWINKCIAPYNFTKLQSAVVREAPLGNTTRDTQNLPLFCLNWWPTRIQETKGKGTTRND